MKSHYLETTWYAKPNDLIGGWCVMPVDETPSYGVLEVADFATEELAEHIAKLHNQWLDRERQQEIDDRRLHAWFNRRMPHGRLR